MTTRDELVEVHRKHRIVKTGKPWYLQGGNRYFGDKPEGFKQVYFCKCGEWEGTHSEHEGHQMDMLIPLIEAEKAAAWDEGAQAIADTHPSWWRKVRNGNPYRRAE